MLYARIASGFVPGGPNDVIVTATNLPRTYSSSSTVNYELGVKSSTPGNRLTVEVSAFYIDWKKIQLNAVVGGENTLINGGAARSEGIEWSLAYVPIAGLTTSVNGAYTDAYLTQPTPTSVNGQAGDRLPAVPLWSGSVNADYSRALSGRYTGFAGLSWRFTGSRYAEFEASGVRQKMPSFSIVDLRAGIEAKQWEVELYVKNVGNEIAINYLRDETLAGGSGPQSAIIYAPRTFGATLGVKL
jgi:outer membrane receptor protein involved in Fe transport